MVIKYGRDDFVNCLFNSLIFLLFHEVPLYRKEIVLDITKAIIVLLVVTQKNRRRTPIYPTFIMKKKNLMKRKNLRVFTSTTLF